MPPSTTLLRQSIASFHLSPADRTRRRRLLDLCFQVLDGLFEKSDTLLQAFVLLTRFLRHGLYRFELLALYDIELAQNVLRLGAHHGLDLFAHALRRTSSGTLVPPSFRHSKKPSAGTRQRRR